MASAARMLSVLAEHGIEGDDARTSLKALDCSIAQGAPSIWDPLLDLRHLTDAQLATTFTQWYGNDAVRAAVVLYRWHHRAP